MAPQALKTTFKPIKILQSFYTGGKVALSQDGRILVSTLEEDVLLTNMESGAELARIEGDTEIITTLAITPKATHLITCSRSFTMRIYALESDEPLTTVTSKLVRTLKAHDAPIIVCAVDPSGSLLATGGSEGLVKVWDIKGGYVTHSFRGHGGVVSALSFFTDTDEAKEWRLASAADDTRIIIWNLFSKTSVKVLESHNSVVRGLDWSADGKLLVSAGRDQIICIWESRKWSLRGTIPTAETMEAVGFLKPGVSVGGQSLDEKSPVVYSGGQRGVIRLWSSSTGKEIVYVKQTPEDEINDVIYNKDLSLLIAVHNDQTLLVHRTVEGLPTLRRLSGHHDEIIDIQYVTKDNSLLAVATNSEDIRLVAVQENSFGDVGVLKGHDDIVICLDTDSTGRWLASGSKDNEARLWRIGSEDEDAANRFSCMANFVGHAESIGAVAISRTSSSKQPNFLITGSKDCTIKRWDIPTMPAEAPSKLLAPRAIFTRKAHDKDINSIDISPDDSLFASASQDRLIKVWSTETGEVLGILRGHRRGVWSVRFGPPSITASNAGAQGSGRLLVSGSGDKTVRLWSLSDYTCIKTLEGHAGVVLRCIWLTGGLQVASAGGEGLVKVWDIRTGECSATLDNHEDKVWGLIARRNDEMLVSAGADSVITFWQDVSEETREAQAKATEHLTEQEQKLSNYIHTSDYRSAIELALELNHPQRLFNLFSSVTSITPPEPSSISGIVAVDNVLADLDDEQLFRLLTRIRDWNTNSKNAVVAQRVLSVLLKSYNAEKFIELSNSEAARKAKKKTELGGGVVLKDIFDAVGRYTERHYARVEELLGESYITDYTLREMEESAFLDGSLANGLDEISAGTDVVMV